MLRIRLPENGAPNSGANTQKSKMPAASGNDADDRDDDPGGILAD
ncbi:MAG: hypothetical protein U0521_23420 [Anaerolineae bacterium]